MQTECVEMLDVREAPLCREFNEWLREHRADQVPPTPSPSPSPSPSPTPPTPPNPKGD